MNTDRILILGSTYLTELVVDELKSSGFNLPSSSIKYLIEKLNIIDGINIHEVHNIVKLLKNWFRQNNDNTNRSNNITDVSNINNRSNINNTYDIDDIDRYIENSDKLESNDYNTCNMSDIIMKDWPKIEDSNFYEKLDIYFKQKGLINKESKMNCNTLNPLLSCNQLLPSTYIHPETPYRSLLLYHNSGSGKTGTSIAIISNFIRSI